MTERNTRVRISQIRGIISDKIEHNVLLNAFRIAINGSLVKHNMVDGITDEFEDESGIDTGASTNEDYDGTNDLYKPTLSSEVELDYMEYTSDGNAQSAYVTDAGVGAINWTERQPIDNNDYSWGCGAISGDGQVMVVGIESGRLYVSTDGGANWTERQPAGDVNANWVTADCDNDGSFIIVGDDNGVASNGRLWISTNSGANWTEVRPAGDVDLRWMAVACDTDGSFLICGAWGGRLWTSTDGGSNWTERRPTGIDEGRNWGRVGSDNDGSNLIAGDYGGRLWTSSDSGVNWTERQPIDNNDYNWYAVGSDNDGSFLGAGVGGGRLYTSADSGANWTERQPAGDVNHAWRGINISDDGSTIVAGGSAGRLYVSIDSGVNWTEETPAGAQNENWRGVGVDEDASTFIAVASGGRIYTGTRIISLQCYSEASIKQQGSYSLKVSATDGALNDTLQNDLASGQHIDLTDVNDLKIYCRASRTGTNFKIKIHDSGGTTSEKSITISVADTWEQTTWDISAISNANKDDIDQIIIEITNADSANTIYIDDFKTLGLTNNMTLIALSTTAEAQSDDARIVIFEEDVDSITLQTDLKAYISRDGGTTWTQVTLADEGDYETNKRVLSGTVDISAQPAGTSMEYKIESLNNKDLKLHGVGLLWS